MQRGGHGGTSSVRQRKAGACWAWGLALAWAVAAALPSPAQPPAAPPAAGAERPAPRRGAIPWSQPLEVVRLAGPVLWPLLGCSLIAITFGLERFVALRRRRVLAPGFLKRFRKRLETGDFDRASAMEFCRSNGSPLAMTCLAAVRLWGYPTSEIHKAVGEAGAVQALALRRNLRLLQSVANVAMLVGLLGTVLGVTHAFNNMAELRGQQRGEELGRGIAEALLATAAGLCVSIPALALYTYFASKVERLVVELSETADELADRVSAEGLAAANAARLGAAHAAASLPLRPDSAPRRA